MKLGDYFPKFQLLILLKNEQKATANWVVKSFCPENSKYTEYLKWEVTQKATHTMENLQSRQRSDKDRFMTYAVTGNRVSRNSPSRQWRETGFLGTVALPFTCSPCKCCPREEFNRFAPFSKSTFCSSFKISVLPVPLPGLKLRYIS